MDVFIMYVLMIIDLTWTLMHHEETGELNPLFERLLMDNETGFVYLKLAANSIAAFIVIYLRHRKPILSRILTIFGILIYGVVVYLHWVVWCNLKSAGEINDSLIWNFMQGR